MGPWFQVSVITMRKSILGSDYGFHRRYTGSVQQVGATSWAEKTGEARGLGYHLHVYILRYSFFLIFLLSCSCQSSSAKRIVKLGHGLDVSHPVHKGMEYMAQKLEEKSGGAMIIQIYPSGQLGQERELLELLQIGSLDMTKVSAAVMENFAPNYRVLGMPYIFKSKEHSWDVLSGAIGKELLMQGEKYWLRGLCFYDAGSRSFYSRDKPIEKPADLSGLKIRVMNSVTAFDMIRALGGSPTPISWGELYTALQQGIVDGAENNPPSFYTSKHYEVCKYYVLDEHSSVPDVLLVSTYLWKRLSEQERDWLQQAADESVEHQKELWRKSVEESLEAVKEAGVEIIVPDKNLFSQQVGPLYEEYESDPEIAELIRRIREIGNK